MTPPRATLPVVKENFLVMVCCLNESKVILQCSNKSVQSSGVGGVAVENPDGNCALMARSLHFIDAELHLVDKQFITGNVLHVFIQVRVDL